MTGEGTGGATVAIHLKYKDRVIELTAVPEQTTLYDFAQAIYDQTQIPHERQTYMIPGFKLPKGVAKLKPTELLNNFGKLQTDTTIKGILAGTPTGMEFVRLSSPNIEPTLEAPKIEKLLQHGYSNLGNTCYVGALLSLLETAEDFRAFICAPERSVGPPLLSAWHNLWATKQLEKFAVPSDFFMAVCDAFPDFRERSGLRFRMQDAEECLSRLFSVLPPQGDWADLFTIKFEETTTVNPAVVESLIPSGVTEEVVDTLLQPEVTVTETKKLSCYMGTPGKPTSQILEGLSLGLTEEIEKNSDLVNRTILYNRERRITHLPKYLLVHMVRFEWKKANSAAGTKACRAKISRRVQYGDSLDLFELCTDALKEKLRIGRDEDEKLREEEVKRRRQDTMNGVSSPPSTLEVKNADGTYKLKSVLTHIGRSADGGHYINWVRCDANNWVKVDDHESSLQSSEATDLQGGLADGFCPYILLYQRRGSLC